MSLKIIDKETAIKLKDAGYNLPCSSFYWTKGAEPDKIASGRKRNHNANYDACGILSAPCVDEVIDWLDSKGIYVFPSLWPDDSDNLPVFTVRIETKSELDMLTHIYASRSEAQIAGIIKATENSIFKKIVGNGKL